MSSATSGVSPERIICAVRHASRCRKNHIPIKPKNESGMHRAARQDRHLEKSDGYGKVNDSFNSLTVVCLPEPSADE